MRRKLIPALVLLITSAACLAEAPAGNASAQNAPIIGVWKANIDSLPMMTLTVEEDKGRLMGAVLFFLIRREPGAAETASAGAPEPLIDPTFEGRTLTFKVNRSHAHAGTESDSPMGFRFELSDDGKIRFLGRGGQRVEMVRDNPY